MIGSIITKTMDLVVLSAKERELVANRRELMADEVAINRSLISSHIKASRKMRQTTIEAAPLIAALKTAAYLRVTSGELSLSRIFPDKLTKPARPSQSDEKGTRQYLSWIENDKTVADLLRRFHRKLELHRTPLTGEASYVDVRYLGFMLVVLDKSLKQR